MLTAYKTWQSQVDNLPRKSRYTLGSKIDVAFISVLELLFVASYQTPREKTATLLSALRRFDVLKFLLRVAWEMHAIDTAFYARISLQMDETGKMLGGWYRGIASKTPPAGGERRE
jgi:hypothetical protein